MKKSKMWQITLTITGIISSIVSSIATAMLAYFTWKYLKETRRLAELNNSMVKKHEKNRERPRVIEMLQKFIKPLINGSGSNIASIEHSINSENFTALHLNLEPNYKFAYIDVINEADLEWIKKKIRECNDLASTINSSVNYLEKEIRNSFLRKNQKGVAYIDELLQNYPKNINQDKNKLLDHLIYCIISNNKNPHKNPNDIYGLCNQNREKLLKLREEEITRKYIYEIKSHLTKARKGLNELKNKLERLRDMYMKEYKITDEEYYSRQIEAERGIPF